MKHMKNITVLLAFVILGSAVLPATVVAQQDSTDVPSESNLEGQDEFIDVIQQEELTRTDYIDAVLYYNQVGHSNPLNLSEEEEQLYQDFADRGSEQYDLPPDEIVSLAQESETESNLVPEEIGSIIQSDMSTATQDDLRTVQEWYSTNSDSLPESAQERVLEWIVQAENADLQSSEDAEESQQYTGPEWDSTAQTTYGFPERWDGNVRLYHVEYDVEDGVARVYIETDEPTTVTLADGTQTQSGAQIKTISEVDGREILSVEMRNPSNKHVSITANQGTYLAFGEGTDLRYDDPTKYPVIVAVGTGIIVLVLIVGLHRFSARYRNKAKNPIEG